MPGDVLSSSKRSRRIFFLRRFLFVFLIIFLVISASFTGLFFIKELKISLVFISGASSLSAREMEKDIGKIMSNKFLTLIPRDRIFSFPMEKIKNDLYSNFLSTKDIIIKKEFPSAVFIQVEKRNPVATLCLEGGKECFYVDMTGFIFGEAPFFSSGVYLKFFDERKNNPGLGEFLLKQTEFEELANFLNFLNESTKITKIYLKESGVYELHTDNGWYLVIESEDDLGAVLDNFLVFLKEFEGELGNIKYIDLRFGNKVFYK